MTPDNENAVEKNSKISLKNLQDMASLDHELSRLNGKVSQITSKVNEDGQRVKVIKITKNKKNMGDEEQQKLQ